MRGKESFLAERCSDFGGRVECLLLKGNNNLFIQTREIYKL